MSNLAYIALVWLALSVPSFLVLWAACLLNHETQETNKQ